MAHQQQVHPSVNDTGLGGGCDVRAAAEERGAGNRKHREARHHHQGRHQPRRHISRRPPRQEYEPRQRRSRDRKCGKPPRSPLEEEPGVEHHQQQGQPPERRLRRRTEGEEEQQRQTDQQQGRGASDRLQSPALAASQHRHTEVEEREDTVHGETRQQGFLVEVANRPHGLGDHREERRNEIQSALTPGNCKAGDDRHQDEQRAEDRQRGAAPRFDGNQGREQKQQRGRSQN